MIKRTQLVGHISALSPYMTRLGENMMEYDVDELDRYDWIVRGHGFFINAGSDDYYRIDYIGDVPAFVNDQYERVYPSNYLRSLEYRAALQAAERIMPDAQLKQELLALGTKYLDMAMSTDVRMIRPKVKKGTNRITMDS